MTRVAIIGAGPAGLVAARTLVDAGADVCVFDKGRRPGGRLNTREHGAYQFDHGAQFFTVRDERISPMLEDWVSLKVVALWKGRLVRLMGNTAEVARPTKRYVGTPSMISLASELRGELEILSLTRIVGVERNQKEWHLHDELGRDHGGFDRVVIAIPAPQAVPLLSEVPELQRAAEAVGMAPSFAGMFVFAEPPPMDFDGAFVGDGPFTWIARDASKPGRPDVEAWVVHASSEWTRRHWSGDRTDIARRFLEELTMRFGSLPDTLFERTHRWGYALADGFAPGVLWDAKLGIGAVGDWCRGGRVEGALVSGIQIADKVVASG